MRDIRADLRERLSATVRQRTELETRERRLRALLRDEEVFRLTNSSLPTVRFERNRQTDLTSVNSSLVH
jgi:hypothetical protein